MKTFTNIYSLLTVKEKKNYKFLIVLMFFAMLFETLGIASIIPMINLFTNQSSEITFVNKFFNNTPKNNLIIIFISFIFLIFLLKNLYLTFYYYLESKFTYNVRYNLGSRLFNYYLAMPYSFHLKKHSSKLITKITQETALVGGSIMHLSILITEILIVLGIGSLLLLVRPQETIIVLILMIVFSLLFYLFFRRKTLTLGEKLVDSQKSKMKILNESLNSIQEIILYNTKIFFSSKFQFKSNEVSRLGYKMSFINKLPKIYFEIFLLIIVVSIIFFSTSNNKDNLDTIGTLGIFLISSLKIIPSLNKIITGMQNIRYSQKAIESLKEDVDNLKSIDTTKSLSEEKIKNFQKISFKNLSFKHNTKKDYILENINLDVCKNDFIGVIGKTGSGKSTFINLLTGILEPTSGNIFLDDKDINKKYGKLRSLIGYVPQDIYLFDETIKQNIAFGLDEKDISKLKLEKSITQAKLSEFVSRLDNKYDYVIGENASKVSGGQKQRIAIARALYNDPQILILDEPTSALDKVTSDEVINLLKILSKTKTIIMITHKLDNLSIFSKVFEIKDKKIINLKK